MHANIIPEFQHAPIPEQDQARLQMPPLCQLQHPAKEHGKLPQAPEEKHACRSFHSARGSRQTGMGTGLAPQRRISSYVSLAKHLKMNIFLRITRAQQKNTK